MSNSTLLQALQDLTRHRDMDALQSALLSVLRDASGAAVAVYCPWSDDAGGISIDEAIVLRAGCAAQAEDIGERIGNLDRARFEDCLLMEEAATIPATDGWSCQVLPLFLGEKKRGVITLHFASVPTMELSRLRELLRVIDNFHAVLHEGAHDQLTGLLNRRTFETRLGTLLRQQRERALQPEQPGTTPARRLGAHPNSSPWLAITDIDRFKRINDNHGHLIGDEVILLLARALRRGFRNTDLLFRFGGEEFVILLAPTPDEHAVQVLERLRTSVQQTVFPIVGNVTISVGFTRIGSADSARAALDRADQALYFVKDTGRNRVESYESLLAAGTIERFDKSGEIELF